MSTGFFRNISSPWRTALCIVGAAFVLACGTGIFLSLPPNGFVPGTAVTIPAGATLSQTAGILSGADIIRSALLYKAYAIMLAKGRTGTKTGDYLFDQPQSALTVAYRLNHGILGYPLIKVTIPEGADTADMAAIFTKDIPGFDAAAFLAAAKPREGYLFPNTYYFTQADTPTSIIKAMTDLFDAEEQTVWTKIAVSGHSEADIVNMASIIQKEATSSADRRLIAGILWKRLAAGMPLQVDPPFYYVLGKAAAAGLTSADLQIMSPYNTYTHTGLPPTPIDSPGLDAIVDAAEPTASSYWFYLSDAHGITHYAATLAEHDANIRKYID